LCFLFNLSAQINDFVIYDNCEGLGENTLSFVSLLLSSKLIHGISQQLQRVGDRWCSGLRQHRRDPGESDSGLEPFGEVGEVGEVGDSEPSVSALRRTQP